MLIYIIMSVVLYSLIVLLPSLCLPLSVGVYLLFGAFVAFLV